MVTRKRDDESKDLHDKLDVILNRACSELKSTVAFIINSTYQIVIRKRTPKK